MPAQRSADSKDWDSHSNAVVQTNRTSHPADAHSHAHKKTVIKTQDGVEASQPRGQERSVVNTHASEDLVHPLNFTASTRANHGLLDARLESENGSPSWAGGELSANVAESTTCDSVSGISSSAGPSLVACAFALLRARALLSSSPHPVLSHLHSLCI